MDDLIQVEYEVTTQLQVILTREQYDAIKNDLEDGLAEYDDAAEFVGLTRNVVDVAEGA